nr:hypothetical protein [Tanacetum cinerariifolium]
MVPAAVLTKSKPVSITAVRPVRTAVLKTSVTRPKQVKPIVTKTNSPPKWHTNRSPSPKVSNSPPKVTAVKAPVVSAAQGTFCGVLVSDSSSESETQSSMIGDEDLLVRDKSWSGLVRLSLTVKAGWTVLTKVGSLLKTKSGLGGINVPV